MLSSFAVHLKLRPLKLLSTWNSWLEAMEARWRRLRQLEVGPGGICIFFRPKNLCLIPQIQPVMLGLSPIMPNYAD